VELTKILRINSDLGLHARSAARIVKLVEQHNAELFLRKGDREIDGSSILAILTLACPKGTDIKIRTVGEDSEPLMARICDLLTQRFDDLYDESSGQADE
jgi:phosphocarrier protein